MRISILIMSALFLLACGPRVGNSAVLSDGESLIFENTELCAAVVAGDKESCPNADCRALVGDNALVCQTGDCAAIIQHDASKCTNPDCTVLVDNTFADGKRSFTGSVRECASANCKALIRGAAGSCTRR